MKILDLRTDKLTQINENMSLACALGNFDGVHEGHADLLRIAAQKPDGATHSAVWTFSVHPEIIMKKEKTRIITSCEMKAELFKSFGIDLLILSDFEEISSLSPDAFAREFLFRKCRVCSAICGFNFRFGKNASGTAETLKEEFSQLGAKVHIVPPKMIDGVVVSSTGIRKLIENGDVESARKFLGHPFSLLMPVTEGRKIGRTIGVPTINQLFPEKQIVPRHGVYACRVEIDGIEHIAISNVGVRPTVTGGNAAVNCETHIIDYDGWLYGRNVRVDFCKFIRPEKKFDDLSALKAQIDKDIKKTKNFFKTQEAK